MSLIAIYPFLNESFTDKSLSMRRQVIETIEKLRCGDSFESFKEKFSMDQNVTVTDEELKKLYISYNFIDSVIEKLVAYCPNIDKVNIIDNIKRKLIIQSLIEIKWQGMLHEIYDTLESAGDVFLEIYFEDEDDTLPKLRILNSKNMIRGLMDSYNNYTHYVYKEYVEDLDPTFSGNIIVKSKRERVIIFEKGRKIIYDPLLKDDGKQKEDKDGNLVFNVEVIENRESYKDDFSLIHIKGRKKQREEFSSIPAERYIDPSLTLDQITSDMRQINRMLGYPLIIIVDGKPIRGAKRTPAGILGVKSDDAQVQQAKVQDIQISNALDSIFKEFNQVKDDLFDIAGLITPSLREKLNVDSSRVVQQLNLPSENKIELYVDNIIDAMRLWFKILLKENNKFDESTDSNVTFVKPTFIIKASPFDELLYKQSETNGTFKSKEETYIENMDTDEQIKLRKKHVNEELGDKNKDKSFSKEVKDKVSKAQGVDNNFK